MTLHHLFAALRAAWWLPLATVLVGGAAAFGITLLLPPQYTASTQLFISANQGTSTTDAALGNQLSQQRVTSYTQLIAGHEVAKRLIDTLGLDETPTEVADKITAETTPNTVLINVDVTDESPEQAQAIAAGIGQVFPDLVAELEKAGGQTSPVAVTMVTQPDLPTEPSSPNPILNVALGCLGGLIVGLGVVLAREALDRTVKDAAQAEELTGSPVLGVVFRDRALESDHILGRRGAESGHSAAAEGFRQIRTNLQFVNVDSPPRTILVTSALPGEGKTTLLVNLALVLAAAQRKVTVVDADLRRPKGSRYLGLVGSVGLTNILAGTADVEDVGQVYADGPFEFIASGPMPPNPGELLSSAAMSDLLVKLREENDYVLVDAAPLLSVADTAGLAPMMDGVLLSVLYGSTRRDQVQEAAKSLRRVGARTLGVVLNVVPPHAQIAATHGYGYGYDSSPVAG